MTNPTPSAQIDDRRPSGPRIAVCLLALALTPVSQGAGPLSFSGQIAHGDDLSAVVSVGEHLIVASDEGAALHVLEPTGQTGAWRVRAQTIRLSTTDREVDIEALAYADGMLYVLGSHSLKRKKLDPSDDEAANLARLFEVSAEPARQRLYRVAIDEKTARAVGPVESVSLRPLLERDALLGRFARIPAVENGINLEGLAVDGKTLVVGFRSPVLREGQVPVWRLSFDDPAAYELRLVALGGQGIRSLLRVEDGFLLLAQPERTGCDDTSVYFWDGANRLTAEGGGGRIERLATIAAPGGGKAEAMALLADDESSFELLVLFDGVPGGHPLRVSVPRPRPAHGSR